MIYYQEDSDSRFFTIEAGTMTAADLEAILTAVEQTAVDVYIVEVNAQQANYPSSCYDHYLEGFDAAGGMHQPVLGPNATPWAYRRRANMQVLFNQGTDSNAYLLDGMRKRGRKPWLGIRMNDIHDGHDPSSSIHGRFWKEHPELRISELSCENGYDYSYAEVRDYHLNFITEALMRYNADGILLDWLRWPTFFPPGTGEERAPLLTDFMAQVKTAVEQAAKMHGHAIELACRVPFRPERALARGLDAVEWGKRGYLDQLILGTYGASLSFDAPVEQWQKAIGKADLPIVVCLGEGYWSTPTLPLERYPITPEVGRGLAAEAYYRGAKGIHCFNFQGFHRREKLRPTAEILLQDLSSPELFQQKTRTHLLHWDDSALRVYELDRFFLEKGFAERWLAKHRKNNTYPAALPREISPGETAEFSLCCGAIKPGLKQATLEVEADVANDTINAAVNKAPIQLKHCQNGFYRGNPPNEIMLDGWNQIEFRSADKTMTLKKCMLHFEFSET